MALVFPIPRAFQAAEHPERRGGQAVPQGWDASQRVFQRRASSDANGGDTTTALAGRGLGLLRLVLVGGRTRAYKP